MASLSGIGFASPERLSTSTRPIAPATCARAAFETNVHVPREASAIDPRSDPGGSVPGPPFGLSGGPQSLRSTGAPFVPTIVPTSTSAWSTIAQPCGVSLPPAGWNGSRRTLAGAPAATTRNAGEKTCVFEVAATEIPSGAVPGEPAVPRPNSSRSFPAEMTETTPAAATLAITSFIASVRGSVSAPPPEKLITSIPSATAASKAATISGVLATLPTGVGTVKTR